MELNEREQNIVNLINQLSEAASDETTTQDAINNIMAGIRQKTQENIKAEMEAAKNPPPRANVQFPGEEMSSQMSDAVAVERQKVMDELASQLSHAHDHGQVAGELIFTRIREVKSPTKAHPTDAGIDFFVPEAKAWDDDFKDTVMKYSSNKVISDVAGISFEGNELIVMPNAHVAIPSGIKTIIPPGLAMMMVNKSGVATKLKLDHSACLIDSEYRDELIFCFFNHNVEPVKIEPDMKITQGLIVPVINLQLQEVLNCVYDDMGKASDRGGGFGSSGTH